MTGHWITNEFNINDYHGFVYLITNITTNKKYIGKKNLWSTVTKKVKMITKIGKKNTKVTSESNWREYTGSCITLNEDIKLLGKDNFRFEIITLCKTRGLLSYTEMELQFKCDVLRAKDQNGDKSYYNSIIGSKIRI